MKLTSLIIPAVLLYAFTRTSSAGGGSPPDGTPPQSSAPVIPVPSGVFNPTNAPAVVNTPAAISQFNKTSAIVWVENQYRQKVKTAGLPGLESAINGLLQKIAYNRSNASEATLNTWQDQLTSLRSQYYAIDKPLQAQMMGDIAAINAGTWGGSF